MYAFDYHQAATLEDAIAVLAADEDAKPLAGGMTLIPTLKQRLAMPTTLVDLGGVADLQGIRDSGDGLTIGAMTIHAAVAASSIVRERIPALADLAGHIGDPQVRNRGTLGGSVANNDPVADYPAAVLALGATVVTNKRRIAAADFFVGLFETALADGELITSIAFPVPDAAAYMKFPNPASLYAMAGVFVARFGKDVRVAVTGAAQAGVFRMAAMEDALAVDFSPAALEAIEVPIDDLNSDIHGSAEYRAQLVKVMAKRAVAACG